MCIRDSYSTIRNTILLLRAAELGRDHLRQAGVNQDLSYLLFECLGYCIELRLAKDYSLGKNIAIIITNLSKRLKMFIILRKPASPSPQCSPQ